MKEILFFLLILVTPVLAQTAIDYRITDGDCDTLSIDTNGDLPTSATNEPPSGSCGPGAPDKRICDEENDCLNINPDGSVNVVSGSPY